MSNSNLHSLHCRARSTVGQIVSVFTFVVAALETAVPSSTAAAAAAAALPSMTASATLVLLGEQFLQSNNHRQHQRNLAYNQSFSRQQKEHPHRQWYHGRHLHRHASHHHSHHLLHLSTTLFNAPFQLVRVRFRHANLQVESVHQRGNSLEQNIVQNFVLGSAGRPGSFDLEVGSPEVVGFGVGVAHQLEVLGDGQVADATEPLEEGDGLLLETGREADVALLTLLVDAVERPVAPVEDRGFFLGGDAADRERQQQQATETLKRIHYAESGVAHH